MEQAHPIDEHRNPEEIRFDALAIVDRAFDTLRALRGGRRMSKPDYLLMMQPFGQALVRLMWEYYHAPTTYEAEVHEEAGP